jgi:pimeloyl-ACP methyl ester carboxylesterase
MKPVVCIAFLVMALSGGTAFAAGPSPNAPVAAQAAAEDDATIEWKFGLGKPTKTIIFMHGLGGNPADNKPLLKAILTPRLGSGAVRVISVRMRPEHGEHSMTDQLERARKVIDSTEGPVFLMGHSFGGKAAFQLSKEYPKEKVAGLIALAPSVNMLQSYWKKITGERVLPGQDVTEPHMAAFEAHLENELATKYVPGSRAKGAKALRDEIRHVRLMRDLAGHDEPAIESNVTRPTLMFHGTKDEAVSIHYARRFANAPSNPGVHMVELPEVNHGFKTSRGVKRDMGRQIQSFIQQHHR